MPRKPSRSTPTPASPCEASAAAMAELLRPGGVLPVPLAEIKRQVQQCGRPALVNPPTARVKPVVLCPGCRAELQTYVSHRQGAVIVRQHRCGKCGLTALKTHQTEDGLLRFAGWARTHPCQTRPEPPMATR